MGNISANFDRSELACSCTTSGCRGTFATVDTELLTMLEVIRQHFDVPVSITSGCRCLTRNTEVNGSKNSQHLVGRAADIKVEGVPASKVFDYCNHIWPDSYGLGKYKTWVHIDSRSEKARW